MGVFRAVDRPVYDDMLMGQVHSAQARKKADLNELFNQGETWEVS